MRLPRDSEITLARRLVVVVGLAYLAAQLLAFSLDRPPSWDEAIYLSQVAPGAEPLPFVPSRARGITFLALPVLQLGGSLAQLRLFLAVASAAALDRVVPDVGPGHRLRCRRGRAPLRRSLAGPLLRVRAHAEPVDGA